MFNSQSWSLLFALTGTLVLAGSRTPPVPAERVQAEGAQAQRKPTICMWESLLRAKVASPQGASLAQVEDLVIYAGGEIAYAVLALEDGSEEQERLIAVPWSALGIVESDSDQAEPRRSLVLACHKERLGGSPSFTRDEWPDLNDPQWSRDVDAYYVNARHLGARKLSERHLRRADGSWRISTVAESQVSTPTGDVLGRTAKIAIDTDGRICYVVLSIAKDLGTGEHLTAVPWDALSLTRTDDRVRIDLACTRQEIGDAPRCMERVEQMAEM